MHNKSVPNINIWKDKQILSYINYYMLIEFEISLRNSRHYIPDCCIDIFVSFI